MSEKLSTLPSGSGYANEQAKETSRRICEFVTIALRISVKREDVVPAAELKKRRQRRMRWL